MTRKINVAVLFGGKSAEHEVSLQSALTVINAIDTEKYKVIPIGITKSGNWVTGPWAEALLNEKDPENIALNPELVPAEYNQEKAEVNTKSEERLAVDVVFPLIHGTQGEDGSIQGMLNLGNVAYVGPSVLSSAICFDKDITKRLLREAGLLVAPGFSLKDLEEVDYETAKEQLGDVLFVKPANAGSSIGVSRVINKDQYRNALNLAFMFDRKVLVEGEVVGRELECAVIGNCRIETTGIGEVINSEGEFYSYENKYLDESGTEIVIPAESIDEEEEEALRSTAMMAYEVLECEGMARVDMFLTPEGQIYVNEVNTIPGFTKISMYPKLWSKTGTTYAQLIDKLITLALERQSALAKLKTTL